MKRTKNKGWRGESKRHSLAARGIKTKQFTKKHYKQTQKEKYRGINAANRKKWQKERQGGNTTPYLPPSGRVYVYATNNPKYQLKANVLKVDDGKKGKFIPITKANGETAWIKTNPRKTVLIKELACPHCESPMVFNKKWQAFKCTNHERPEYYEVIKDEDVEVY